MSENRSTHSLSPMRNHSSKYQQAIKSKRYSVDTGSSSRKVSDMENLYENRGKDETFRTMNRRRMSYVDGHTEKETNYENTGSLNRRRSSYVDDHNENESRNTKTLNRRRSSYVDDHNEMESKYNNTRTVNRRRSSYVDDHNEMESKYENTGTLNRRRSSYVDDHTEKGSKYENTGTLNRRRSSYVDEHNENESKNTKTLNRRRSSYVDDHNEKARRYETARTLNLRRSSYVDDHIEKKNKCENTGKLSGRHSSYVDDHNEKERKYETARTLSRRRSVFMDDHTEEGRKYTNADIVIRDEVTKPKKRVTFADDIVESISKNSNVPLVIHKDKRIPRRRNSYVDVTEVNKRNYVNAGVETRKSSLKSSKPNTFVNYIDEKRGKSAKYLKLKRHYSHMNSKKYERFNSPKYRRRASHYLNSNFKYPKRSRVHRSPSQINEQLQNSTEAPQNETTKQMIMSYLPLCVYPETWFGSISSGGLFKFNVMIEPIGGFYYQFNHLTEHNLNICCGIYQTAVWNCLYNILKSKKKNISLVVIKPKNISDLASYNYWFYYFHTRRQVAHIALRNPNMSFFHIVPLPAGQRIDGTILKKFKVDPSSHEIVYQCNTLLGLMILKPSPDLSYISLKKEWIPLPLT